MLYPNPDMLLRIAQGDAYCMATEYVKLPRDQAIVDEALDFVHYCKHPTHNLPAGSYTDDTQMSIAVAEVIDAEQCCGLPDGDGFLMDKMVFAVSFVRCFRRDRRNGYSRNFQKFLESVYSGEEFLSKIKTDSDKNGAAMRAVPIGVLARPDIVLGVARNQARITHDTPGGILSAQAVALMSHYALYESMPLETEPLYDYCIKHLPAFDLLESPPDGPVKGPGVGIATARAVFHLLSERDSLLTTLEKVIRLGGDTDTVGAITLGIASCRVKTPLPDFFEYGLEPGGPFGVPFLKALGKHLMNVTG